MKKIFFNKRNKIELKEIHITSHVDIDWSVFAAIRLFHFQASLLHHSIDWLAHCSPAEFICFHLLLSPVVSSSLIVRSCYGHCIIIALHNIRNWLLMMHQKLQILIKTFFFYLILETFLYHKVWLIFEDDVVALNGEWRPTGDQLSSTQSSSHFGEHFRSEFRHRNRRCWCSAPSLGF